ncbi:tRNA-guanine transglycosylase DpdA [Streptomyces sporangiiformans]|uniref:Queuine/other tRNA-ribosyltransferase n=1 Tax=Streptomyces sporangiiformans TaxID=2315329 RepID=A0A505D7P4_9ACTN|nr:tRNA-guanine transglycosylase DpdA [Streptomyces sporangiiformans]TPQ18630.1 queuine/other tRNA-ribosyltransferase [Streptomyces sporangiiformans]
MKFYFPDSQDLVSPTYDFINDEYSPYRVRQRDDVYAHEIVTPIPYDGILVSKAIIDGSVKGAGKYSTPQRERLYRLGVRQFFRLNEDMETLGDCGAFNYINEEIPPYTVDEVVSFYETCGFDAGVSIDHIIFGYIPSGSSQEPDPAWVKRQEISLRLAQEFLDETRRRGEKFQPVGAAQGWGPQSYAHSVAKLQEMGYQRIALGGMVPLKSHEILACLEAISEVHRRGVDLHLLGVNRVESMEQFARLGVTSFDSTSAFRQAFMDDRNNYHTATDSYTAIRVPQVDGNPALKRMILSGTVSQADAIAGERACLRALRGYGNGNVSVEEVLTAIKEYEALILGPKKKSYLSAYERTLRGAPWKDCPCALCREHGVEIAIFRGTERNKRRGFHNLSILETKMRSLNFA